ncbi:MAG: hypothetical protein ACE5GZ_04370, partial [Gammaproteobacteria bacterium]
MTKRNSMLAKYYIFIGVVILAVVLYRNFDDLLDKAKSLRPVPAGPSVSRGSAPPSTQAPPVAGTGRGSGSVQQAIQPPPGNQTIGKLIDAKQGNHFGPVVPVMDGEDRQLFRDHFKAKLASPEYISRKNRKGIPRTYQGYPEEALIKQDRARIAARIKTPDGVTPISIPVTSLKPPSIDGRVEAGEWQDAIEIPIGGTNFNTRILLLSDGRRLYLACRVPDDSTEAGYDQFRFYYHWLFSR